MSRVMIDTNALIRYSGITMPTVQGNLSNKAKNIITSGLEWGEHILFLCAISLLEVWENIPDDQDYANHANFYSLTKQLYQLPNLRILPLDNEVLKMYSKLDYPELLREHDRIIYSTAKVFECDILLTADSSMNEFNEKTGNLIQIL